MISCGHSFWICLLSMTTFIAPRWRLGFLLDPISGLIFIDCMTKSVFTMLLSPLENTSPNLIRHLEPTLLLTLWTNRQRLFKKDIPVNWYSRENVVCLRLARPLFSRHYLYSYCNGEIHRRRWITGYHRIQSLRSTVQSLHHTWWVSHHTSLSPPGKDCRGASKHLTLSLYFHIPTWPIWSWDSLVEASEDW